MSESLDRMIQYLQKENKELKAKCNTLEKALDKACTFISAHDEEITGFYRTPEEWKEWALNGGRWWIEDDDD